MNKKRHILTQLHDLCNESCDYTSGHFIHSYINIIDSWLLSENYLNSDYSLLKLKKCQFYLLSHDMSNKEIWNSDKYKYKYKSYKRCTPNVVACKS